MNKQVVWSVCSILLIQNLVIAEGYLRTENARIVNDQGPILLRGIGLGGWMLQEGYMLQTESFANAQHEIREKIEALTGTENTETFYNTWFKNFCRKIDIDSIAAWGLNSIRMPLHYNLFTLPIEEEPVRGQNTWINRGFEITDKLLEWCEENQLYLILDLHAAPGGQGKDAAISDYDSSKPSLWESSENRSKTVALWRRLAEHYSDKRWIGGYDLINETNWSMSNNVPLKQLYLDITSAVREVDPNHILFIEGNWFANDFTGLTPPWDTNMVYSFHKYWSYNDQASIQWMLNIRNTYDIPIWCGEAGENSNAWFTDAIKLLEQHDIGWAWWPLKKVESISGPLSIPKPAGYQYLLDYWSGKENPPSAGFAFDVLMDLAENSRLENCIFQAGVMDAMTRQVRTTEAKPYKEHILPGMIYASEYDFGTDGIAYHDRVSADYHVSSGTYTAWNTGWNFRNDGVDIDICQDTGRTNGYCIGWIEKGEWLTYTVWIEHTGTYDVQFRIASEVQSGKLGMQIDQDVLISDIEVPDTGGWQNWSNIVANNLRLEKGLHQLKLVFDAGSFNLNFISFTAKSIEKDTSDTYYKLYDSRPNPFQKYAYIKYELFERNQVLINIYDIQGRKIKTLLNARKKEGVHSNLIDAGELASGIYIVEFNVGTRSSKQKIMLLK